MSILFMQNSDADFSLQIVAFVPSEVNLFRLLMQESKATISSHQLMRMNYHVMVLNLALPTMQLPIVPVCFWPDERCKSTNLTASIKAQLI